jgi:primosomal protein N' (replication factor Y) (superfamily II helicase)
MTSENNIGYLQILFPFALPRPYTYSYDKSIEVQVGCRVEVELRNKVYSALVVGIQDENTEGVATKPIISLLDENPIVTENQIKLWQWIANYYCCTIGEVMEAAIPSGLKLNSETLVKVNDVEEIDIEELTDEEVLITDALSYQSTLTIEQFQDILGKKNIFKVLQSLVAKNCILVEEALTEKYKPKKVKMVRLNPKYKSIQGEAEACELVKRSELQLEALSTLIDLSKISEWHVVSELSDYRKIPSHVIKALEKKGLIDTEIKNQSRLDEIEINTIKLLPLNEDQSSGLAIIEEAFILHKPVLIHGVTGAGKTRLYQELIKKTLDEGKQVLYLLPEITLTAQMVKRLVLNFGNDVQLYHSKLNDNARVEIWNNVLKGKNLIISARSGVFLPFTNLGLVIVDEEHDSSFKQEQLKPYFHARDVALYLAKMVGCNILLGSATPSLESYYNVEKGLYQLVELNKRFGDIEMPKLEIVDQAYERRTGRYRSILSHPLKMAINECLENKEQVILFLNRRGYVPNTSCKSCGWSAVCKNCDVHLTLHKFVNILSCHYCSMKISPPRTCPSCNSHDIGESGMGTEKIENIVAEVFPKARIGRLDVDTAKTKTAIDKIIASFENHEFDIMIGTQMVTKGFDFEKVTLVGIIDADASLRFPDFRANERTFQLITQVAGRAGRRAKQGLVMIQTYAPTHPVIQEILSNNFRTFYKREIAERREFIFPPLVRLIKIELKHKELTTVINAANHLTSSIKNVLKNRVTGPIIPSIERIRNQYIRHISIKLERDQALINKAKDYLVQLKDELSYIKEFKSVKITIIVD